MNDAERNLGTSLDWVVADHWNTDNPYVHMSPGGLPLSGDPKMRLKTA